MGIDAPKWVILVVSVGMLACAMLAFVVVSSLQAEAVDRVLAERGERLEQRLGEMVDRFAEQTFGPEGEGLERFGQSVVAAVRLLPSVRDVVVLTPERRVVNRWAREGEPDGCWRLAPLAHSADRLHPQGEVSPVPVGCLAIPVLVDGRHRGAVVVHSERAWLEEGHRVRELVTRTSLRLVPVFLAYVVLLAGLLLVVSRAARRWRLRAASAERVEALGAIADGINHEIKNPLNAVGLSLQYLERTQDDPESQEVLSTAREQTTRIRETLEEFVRFTKVSRLSCESGSVAERLLRAAAGRGIELRIEGDAQVWLDPVKFDTALAALVGLLVDTKEGEAPIRVRISASRKEWELELEAPTPGLDPAVAERLFDPYLRPRPRDVGRGLAFARAVFQAHGGDLIARLKGTRLLLRGGARVRPAGEVS